MDVSCVVLGVVVRMCKFGLSEWNRYCFTGVVEGKLCWGGGAAPPPLPPLFGVRCSVMLWGGPPFFF